MNNLTTDDITGQDPEEKIPELKELIDQNFRQFESLFLATQSPKYQIGRDDYDPIELGEDFVQATRDYRSRPDFMKILKGIVERHEDRPKGHKAVITGPFNADLLLDLHAACRYFVDNAGNFSKRTSDRYDNVIECRLPGTDNPIQKVGCTDKSGKFDAGFYGILPSGKRFHLSVGYDPAFILPFCLDHPYDFMFDIRSPEKIRTEVSVHLNGPKTNPVLKELLILARSIINYAESQVEEDRR